MVAHKNDDKDKKATSEEKKQNAANAYRMKCLNAMETSVGFALCSCANCVIARDVEINSAFVFAAGIDAFLGKSEQLEALTAFIAQ